MYPKQKPLSGRWVTVTDHSVFFQKSIASGMLGSVEASEIQADVDAQRTVGTIVETRAECKCAQPNIHLPVLLALGLWTLMDVSDVKVTDEDSFPVPQH